MISYAIAMRWFYPSMASSLTFIVRPFLLEGSLNFVTDDPVRKRNFLDMQLFITTCFAVTWAYSLVFALRISNRSGFAQNIPQVATLALIIVFLLLLKRAQDTI